MIRGLSFYFPFLAPVVLALMFAVHVAFLDSPECASLLGINVSLLGLVVFCFVLPVIFTIASLYLLFFSLKARGQDVYPPSDIPWAGAFRKLSGGQVKLPKVLGYVLPFVGVWMIWLGVTSFIELADGRTLSEMGTAISTACERQG